MGRNLKRGATVVFESTVYPGATEEVCMDHCQWVTEPADLALHVELVRLGLLLTGSREQGEDLAQDAFAALVRDFVERSCGRGRSDAA